MASPTAWPNPLDDPLAVAAAGAALVLLTRLVGLPLWCTLPLAVALALGLTWWRRGGSRRERLRDRRVSAGIEEALERSQQLATQAELVRTEALARFQSPDHLDGLGLVQLCCERLRALPERIAERRPLLESGGGVLLPAEDLVERLRREEQTLRRETSPTLRQERTRLVEQLRSNLEAARLGIDERDGRLLALSTRLERIDGGLRHLQRQVERQWPSSEAGDAAITQAVEPLDEALDQIEGLLAAGRAVTP
ncbi:MAG: hypothetical protein VKM17_06370 [Cyanobacteriota bacterium]|nr:hypothetical protein [Cyanobacteriota bacterium]